VQLAVIGGHGVARLLTEATGETLGQHLRHELTDVRQIERLEGHMVGNFADCPVSRVHPATQF
jgi:hypothetical protein